MDGDGLRMLDQGRTLPLVIEHEALFHLLSDAIEEINRLNNRSNAVYSYNPPARSSRHESYSQPHDDLIDLASIFDEVPMDNPADFIEKPELKKEIPWTQSIDI